MKCHKLEVRNVKRTRIAIISPKTDVINLAGKNKQGKSSILDSFLYLLGSGRELPDKPIHGDEKKASIEADFGDFIAKRTFTEKGSYLSVKLADGSTPPDGAQKFLDRLVGSSLDIMSYLTKTRREQREILMKLVDVDITTIDREIKIKYDARTPFIVRERDLKGKLEVMQGELPSDCPKEEIGFDGVQKELEEIRKHNEGVDGYQEKISDLKERIERWNIEISQLQEKVSNAQLDIDTLESDFFGVEKIGDEEVKAKVETIKQHDELARKWKETVKTEGEYFAAGGTVSLITTEINDLEAQKTRILEETVFPVAGMGFGDDCVTYHDLPLDQASQREQIEVALGMTAAIIPEDGIRILRIRDGSLMDSEARASLQELAERYRAQIWVETVSDKPTGADTEIWVEDGEVK